MTGRGRDEPATKAIVAQQLDRVEARSLEWLWAGRIPRGKITILDGDPGLGKSLLTMWIAAAVTAGRPLPGQAAEPPADVVLMNAEDDLSDTIKPRLEAAGADLRRIVHWDGIDEGNELGVRPPIIPQDFDALEELIVARAAVLCIVDPLVAYLDNHVDASIDQDVRRCLARLKMMAQRTGCAMVLIRHLNKSGMGSAVYRGGGSIGIIGAARSGLVIAPHPEKETQRVLAVVKANLAAPAPSLAYEVVDSALNGNVIVRWIGETIYSADELLSSTAREEAPAVAEAADFLRTELAGGAQPVRLILAAAKKASINEKALRRAKARMNLITKRKGYGEDGQWWWGLYEWTWDDERTGGADG